LGLALHKTKELLYVAEAGATSVAVVDIHDGAVTRRLAIGAAPFLLAVDEQRALLYVAAPGDKSVWAISLHDEARRQRLPVPGLGLTLGMTVDEGGTVSLVYALSPKLRAVATIVSANSGALALKTIIEGNYALPLAEAAGIAAHGGRIYVTDGGCLLVLDEQTGHVIDRLAISAAADTFGIALLSQGGQVVIADARGGPALVVRPALAAEPARE